MSTRLRARRLLLRQGRTLAVVLATVGLLAMAAGAYAYATPPEEVVTERVDVQTASTELEPSAVVTGRTTLYERGERLVDPSAFLFAATPTVELTAVTEVPSGVEVAVDQRLVLELSATNDGEAFWSERTLLGADSGRVTDGRAELSTALNASELRERFAATREELGDVGVLRADLNLTVDYDTGRYRGRLTVTAPVVLTDSAYWFEGDLAASAEHHRTVTRTERGSPDLGAVAGLELAGLAALAVAGAIGRLEWREDDELTLETALAHSRYDEWISEGEFPTQADKKFVHINTLEDLVDVAIDSNKRVVYDRDVEAYAVADGDLVYYYAAERGDIDSWLDI